MIANGIGNILSRIGILLLSAGAVFAAGDFEGRWDLTEKAQGREYASWLEISKKGSGWTGRLLSRSGHAMPAKVLVEGDELNVVMLDDNPERQRPSNRKWPALTGRLVEGKLEGTGSDSRGRPFEWTGSRAPDRSEGCGRKVTWGKPIQIFNGKDLGGWQPMPGRRPSQWMVNDGVLANKDSGANLRTTGTFRDFKLQAEYKVPEGSNSGIYLRGRYEMQVVDQYGRPPHSRGNGGIYGYIAPTVNAVKPAGEWNTLDATIIGYRVTIVLNGRKVVDGKLIDGITGGAIDSNEAAPGPILLQGDHGPVYYRNVVLTPAK